MITWPRTSKVFCSAPPDRGACATLARPGFGRAASQHPFYALLALLLAALITVQARAQPEPSERPKTKPATTKTPAKAPKKSTDKAPAPGQLAEEGRALFPEAAQNSSKPSADPDWRILIATVTGPDAASLAQQALWKVQNVGQLTEAYVVERPGPEPKEGEPPQPVWLVCYGKYPSSADPRAQADLARIRDVTVASEHPFMNAVLLPPADAERAITSAYDLRSVRATLPEDRARYTLAIGVYTRSDMSAPDADELKECRKLAEDAVEKLRREGEQAYFYHGPNGSQVTIGVFGDEDFDPANRPGVESPALLAARKKYPNYLLNGMGQRKTVKTTDGKKITRTPTMVRSTLVEIPK